MTASADLASRFSAGASVYRDVWAPVLLPHARRLLAELPLASARQVLELAAGPGVLVADLRRVAPHAHLVVTDVARGMVALAPADCSRAVMDATRLALASAVFDAALMAFGIFFVPDPHAALAEVRRVLAPGGAFALTSWCGEPAFPAHLAWIDEVRAAGIRVPDWSPDVLSEEALRRSLERAGFGEARTFVRRFDHQHEPEAFLRLRFAMAGPRLAALADPQAFVGRVRARLGAMPRRDFFDPTEILYAVARA